jgi:alpha-L-arabinofuranosidase
MFDYANEKLRELNAEIVDEHYYRNPEWFLDNATRYDEYDRKGPKIFAGEYAAQSVAIASPDNKNNWECALSEAAFMTGLERNAEVVVMSSYAPLFAHVDGWQWTPDLIWFDNLKSFGTANYYVQKMFSTNSGTKVVPVLLNEKPVTGQDRLYASSVLDEKNNAIIVKVVNASDKAQQLDVVIEGGKKLNTKANVTSLSASSLTEFNTLQEPTKIAPVQKTIPVKGKKVSESIPANTFVVIRISTK